MAAGRRKRNWWVRLPLGVTWLLVVGCAALILHYARPMTSLGRGLDGMTPDQKIGALALDDHLRRHPWFDYWILPGDSHEMRVREGGPFILWHPRFTFDDHGVIWSACAADGQAYRAILLKIVQNNGYRISKSPCQPAGLAFWMARRDRDGLYQTGLGTGGEVYQAFLFGNVAVIFQRYSWIE